MNGENPEPAASNQVLTYFATAPVRPIFTEDVSEVRRNNREEALAGAGIAERVFSVESVSANSIPARLYRPTGSEPDVLVWLHGGGWVSGDLDSCDAVARALANRARCAVLSVDYRLAPEHPYPAAADDSWAAILWAARNFRHVAVGGDSAGGNLSASAALRARDAGLTLTIQLLVYPVLDYRPDSASYDAYRSTYARFAGREGFGQEFQAVMRQIWNWYIPDASRRTEPYASPLRASSLSGVAQALIVAAEHDILRGEGEDFAVLLRQAGVAVELLTYPGQIHGFYQLPAMMADSTDALTRSAAAVKAAFAGHNPAD